jgi:hypothetical protein
MALDEIQVLSYRVLSLNEPADFWYQGAGATQDAGSIFGYVGRPSGGSTDLTLYHGPAWGGEVIRRIYPSTPDGSLSFIELTTRF